MKNPFREKQAEQATWTVIGYGLANVKGHSGIAKHVWRALNLRTGKMGPARDKYDDATRDFE